MFRSPWQVALLSSAFAMAFVVAAGALRVGQVWGEFHAESANTRLQLEALSRAVEQSRVQIEALRTGLDAQLRLMLELHPDKHDKILEYERILRSAKPAVLGSPLGRPSVPRTYYRYMNTPGRTLRHGEVLGHIKPAYATGRRLQ